MTPTENIVRTVCEYRGVASRDLLGRLRTKDVAQSRQEAMHLLRATSKLSLPQIGRCFDRDHTTVLHSLGAVSLRMEDDDYRREIDEMTDRLSRSNGFFQSRNARPVFKSIRGNQ